ncbi:serine aminopeptidase domain-containing protein [Bartonella sp. B41]
MKTPLHYFRDQNLPLFNIHNSCFEIAIDREIRFAITRPKTESYKGTVVILESYVNAIEEYFLPMSEISKRGFYTAIFDWFGREVSHTNTTKQNWHKYFNINNNINDLDKFLQNIVYPNCPPPYYILAYGMGGLIALSGLDIVNNFFNKMLCVSPLFAPLGYKANSFQHKLMQFFSDVGLGFLPAKGRQQLKQQNMQFQYTNEMSLSSNFLLPTPTFRWMSSTLNAISIVKKNILDGRLRIPTLFVLANKNNIANNVEGRRLCQNTHLTDSITIVGAELSAIIHGERYKKQFWAAFDAFISYRKSIM